MRALMYALVAGFVAFATPASAAVDLNQGEAFNWFTSNNTTTGATFTETVNLLEDGLFAASVSAVGQAAAFTSYTLSDAGGVVATGTIANVLPTNAFAFISPIFLSAGSYTISLGGSYLKAAISGEVSLTPVPAAALLFGTALVGAAAWRRRVAK